MKRFILLATIFAFVLSLSAQRRMQVWEGNTYMQFFTTDVDSVTFLSFPDGILQECKEVHDTIIKTVTVHDTITQTLRDTITKTIKDTVYINNCDENSLATVQTTAVTHSTYNSLVSGGKVFFGSSEAITERGICYATHSAPTTEDYIVKASRGTGTFTITITGLAEATSYYLRTYAINKNGVAYGNEIMFTTPSKPAPSSTLHEGACKGKFSVSANKQVAFSKGNLQYRASTDTWRFAENQTDYIGEANSNISATYDGWIDLFGWGTSGFDNTANDPAAINYQPWATSTEDVNYILVDSTLDCTMQHITGECVMRYNYLDGTYNQYGYGPSTNMSNKNLVGRSANYDWGVYNAICNGGNIAGLWRTLTLDEWSYLLNNRENASYLKSSATVNGVRGMIILPDDFVKPSSISWKGNGYNSSFTLEQWQVLETAGAIFLPAAGMRGRYSGNTQRTDEIQTGAFYWTATALYCYGSYSNGAACYARLLGSGITFLTSSDNAPSNLLEDILTFDRYAGYSVRLVQDL